MSAPARLLSVRVQGFKSFADKTAVDFGPGISAIVGPNGSGKSNLADALRWSLGEQGRALRARKSEDVVWAGSEKRSATGMADVTLILDNGDGLLPVEYEVVELGRRLYRSGENEYLLNRTRVRLRDLVDLLDAAHLADNAFLFIGQGMVDQALALRPEERRPLFEEVAGVRRHERRRRRSEDQLVEAEANLARVRDILGELRPQARRLAAQAEQQAARRTTADELIEAVLLAAHHRWHGAATQAAAAHAAMADGRAAVDSAMAALAAAEDAVRLAADELAGFATDEGSEIAALDEAVRRATDLRLEDGRLAAEIAAEERERSRTTDEIAATSAEIEEARRTAASPLPEPDLALDDALRDADRALADAIGELAALRAASGVAGSADSLRRAAATKAVEIEGARRALAEADRRVAEASSQASAAEDDRAVTVARHDEARRVLEASGDAEVAAGEAHSTAKRAREAAEAERAGAAARLAEANERRRILGAAIEVGAVDGSAESGLAVDAAARRLGDELDVEPAWRAAVDAALANALGAPVIRRRAIADLAGGAGVAIVEEDGDGPTVADRAIDVAFRERLATASGGVLEVAIRRDGTGVARSLLARTGWLPDLETALALQPEIPVGWTIVTRDGGVVLGPRLVAIGPERHRLERQADRAAARAAAEDLDVEIADLRMRLAEAEAGFEAAQRLEQQASTAEVDARVARQRAADQERLAGRAAETALREAAWHAAQLDRAEAVRSRATDELDRHEADGRGHAGERPAGAIDAIASWEAREQELRIGRDRLAAERASQDIARRAAEARQATALATVAAGESRVARLTADLATRVETLTAATARRDELATALAGASAGEAAARARLAGLRSRTTEIRTRLAAAERDALAARERLRQTEDAARASEVAEIEARLALESVREAVIIDLLSAGDAGLARLGVALPARTSIDPGDLQAAADSDPDGAGPESEDASGLVAQALQRLTPAWEAEAPAGDPPSPGRLASLRRRFHELGAANPYADQEYAELAQRLAGLEAQETDLQQAIESTRRLIGELNALIADQFRTTFAALETAFDRRFRQLFGGGYARLELTEPSDLSATGVEIVARPPGKKPQALAMLSGGERALTAVALLFAMLEVRPVPFCVLDEVDAALDEANIGRFTDALVELAAATQFIVITHNRGTIEIADALYGVTVGEDSVSRVISLRLDEATAIADQQRMQATANPTAVPG